MHVLKINNGNKFLAAWLPVLSTFLHEIFSRKSCTQIWYSFLDFVSFCFSFNAKLVFELSFFFGKLSCGCDSHCCRPLENDFSHSQTYISLFHATRLNSFLFSSAKLLFHWSIFRIFERLNTIMEFSIWIAISILYRGKRVLSFHFYSRSSDKINNVWYCFNNIAADAQFFWHL